MKELKLILDDNVHKKLSKVKKKTSWYEFLITPALKKIDGR